MSENLCHQKRTPPGGKTSRFLRTVWMYFYSIVFGHTMGLHFLFKFLKQCKKIDKNKSYSGQVCVMTGGTRGIGLEIVKTLLELDFTVVLGVRNMKTMEIGIENIRKNGVISGQAKISYLNLKSLKSVQTFSDEVLRLPETENIDILINHAGIFQNDYEVTEDNVECHFQVNYLSHFLLTNLLLPRIKETAGKKKGQSTCHIINTSSHMHYTGSVNFDNLYEKKMYVPLNCYCDTKLCQILHANSQQSRLKMEGVANIQVYACHPGEIDTQIFNDANKIIGYFIKFICESKETAVNNVLYPALNPEVSKNCGGKYFENGQKTKPSREADNEQIQKRLWDISMKLTGSCIT